MTRERAPTITIDTTAVSSGNVPLEVRPSSSFESRDSRPTSGNNLTSPSGWTDHGNTFLSVPPSRSRGNSVNADDGEHSPTSGSSMGGKTYVPSSHSGERHASVVTPYESINDPDALKPDPNTEGDFHVEDNKFAFSPGLLNKLINPKSLSAFYALGGIHSLEKGLRTNVRSGLSMEETTLEGSMTLEEAKSSEPSQLERLQTHRSARSAMQHRESSFYDRKRIFKDNRLPERQSKGFWELVWLAYNDKMLILLSVAAVISLALGIYQSVHPEDPNEAHVEWVEGVAIMVAIVIVVMVGAMNDYQKERQFVKLNRKKEDRFVKVIRSGKSLEISVHDVLVGDVMHLEPGDMIPADGIFIGGHNVKCDESSVTGESDIIKKQAAKDVFKALENHESVGKLDPFIISGAKVNEGVGTYLVTSVGVNSSYGKMMMSLQEDAQSTPLQSKLNNLAEYIAKLGLAAGLLLFIALFIKFLATLSSEGGSADEKGQRFLTIFITTVTIIVVAVPEGLPLAVTLSLAFATTRMLKDNNLVRLLRACETMGNATTVCSDKTGTLTQNIMTVVSGAIGPKCRFGDKLAPEESDRDTDQGSKNQFALAPSDTSPNELVASLSNDVKNIVLQSIVVNTTAFEGTDEKGLPSFIGSKTESALLGFARTFLGMGPLSEEREHVDIAQLVPFDSSLKYMATVVKLSGEKYRAYIKGAPEMLLRRCNRIIQDPKTGLADTLLNSDDLDAIRVLVESYASRSLRTIGLIYKDYEQWPPKGIPTQEDDPKEAVFEKAMNQATFIGVVGIQDPLRDGVSEAVETCKRAGVVVRMVTGDNALTARAIASECGILTEGGVVLEGPAFRRMSKLEQEEIIPKLRVLARSSPGDKQILVRRLKGMGETVAVTGDGTNDAPALKTADVGFSMGISGTEVAKEASAIILMDDNFTSIVKALMWGRAVNDSVKKFLQFQITVNITAVVLTFISAVASGSETSVLTAVQLLWVNLIMDTFAALALATDPPMESVLDRKPEPKSAPLISVTMWKMIVGQAIYQLVITLVLHFSASSFSWIQDDSDVQATVVFNTFVWMQIFNQYNSRRLDNRFNVFEGIWQNYFFISIQFIIIGCQILIVFVGGAAFSVHKLDGLEWVTCLVLGFLSVPIAILIRLIPDSAILKVVPPSWFENKASQDLEADGRFEWNPALEEIREELSLMKKLRGGRLSVLKYKLQHPKEMLPRSRSGSRSSRSRSNSYPRTPSNEFANTNSSEVSTPRSRLRSNSAFGPAAAMAGIVAGSIAGWSPIERRDEEGFNNVRRPSNSGNNA